MSECLGNQLPDQIKSSKVVWTATSKAITIGWAVNNIDGTEFNYLTDAIGSLGIATGDVCPADDNCLATSFEAESLDGKANNAADVKVTYVGFDYYGSPTQASGGTVPDDTNLSYSYNEALNQDQTNFNIANANTPLIVYYWPNPANIGTKNLQVAQQGVTIPVLKPYSTKVVRFFYTVPDGFPDTTISTLQGYVGKYNTDVWDGGAVKTWLCTGVTCNPVGLPQQVLVECSFYYKPETWLQWAFFKDPNNGGSPIGALKNLADPNQTIPTTGSNGAAGFLPYTGIAYGTSFGFE